MDVCKTDSSISALSLTAIVLGIDSERRGVAQDLLLWFCIRLRFSFLYSVLLSSLGSQSNGIDDCALFLVLCVNGSLPHTTLTVPLDIVQFCQR